MILGQAATTIYAVIGLVACVSLIAASTACYLCLRSKNIKKLPQGPQGEFNNTSAYVNSDTHMSANDYNVIRQAQAMATSQNNTMSSVSAYDTMQMTPAYSQRGSYVNTYATNLAEGDVSGNLNNAAEVNSSNTTSNIDK